MTEASGWSSDMNELTRDFLTGGGVPMSDEVAMKNADGRFATVSLSYAISPGTGPVDVTDCRTGEVTAYPSLDAMIAAGWAVD